MKLKSGDMVVYMADVHKEYTGQKAVAMEFDLHVGQVNLKFADGNQLWAFWDEIIVLEAMQEEKVMMDEYKIAETVLNKINEKGPVNIDWNNKGWWIRIIVSALREAGIGVKSGKVK